MIYEWIFQNDIYSFHCSLFWHNQFNLITTETLILPNYFNFKAMATYLFTLNSRKREKRKEQKHAKNISRAKASQTWYDREFSASFSSVDVYTFSGSFQTLALTVDNSSALMATFHFSYVQFIHAYPESLSIPPKIQIIPKHFYIESLVQTQFPTSRPFITKSFVNNRSQNHEPYKMRLADKKSAHTQKSDKPASQLGHPKIVRNVSE